MDQPPPATKEREKEIRRRLFAYLKPHKKTILAGLLCAAGVAAITSLLAVAVKLTVNAMAEGHVGRLNFICMAVVAVFVLKRATKVPSPLALFRETVTFELPSMTVISAL